MYNMTKNYTYDNQNKTNLIVQNIYRQNKK